MAKKSDFSKKILNSLSGKPAIRVEDLKTGPKTEKYALTRSLKNLADTGHIETLKGGQGDYVRLTPKGRIKAQSSKLNAENSLVNPAWDGKWRIVLLDLPENRKQEREALRYLLKKAGFIMLKNSAWVSPFPFEFLFANIKKDFGLTTELMIVVSDTLDEETRARLKKTFF